MKKLLFALLVAAGVITSHAAAAPPIRVLLVTGGPFHNYALQRDLLTNGISARANVSWQVIYVTNQSTKFEIPEYNNPHWADNCDVVIHDECFADEVNEEYIGKIVAPHRAGKPAIVLHCAMHTFRALPLENPLWREFLGVTTTNHGQAHPFEIRNVNPQHPVMKGFPETWKTGTEELYNIVKVWPTTTPLARATERDGKDNPIIWVSTFGGKSRIFGTTLAHNDITYKEGVYLDVVTRGLLWACDKLADDGNPKPGYEAVKNSKP